MKLLDKGLVNAILKKNIKIKLDDWVHVSNMKYEGHKFGVTNIPKYLNYDRDHDLSEMIRPKFSECSCRHVRIHYMYVHIFLNPRGSNHP